MKIWDERRVYEKEFLERLRSVHSKYKLHLLCVHLLLFEAHFVIQVEHFFFDIHISDGNIYSESYKCKACHFLAEKETSIVILHAYTSIHTFC